MDAATLTVIGGLAFALAAAITFVLRRPRLAVELSLRGGARHGTLYVVLANRGRTSARGLRVEVAWLAGERRARVEARALEDLAPADAARLEVTRLLSAVADQPEGWDALEVRVRARNAFPATARLPLTRREAAGEEEPVRYVRGADLPCPDATDGKHRFETHRVENDGVTETWRACGRCRHVEREPLTREQEATQRRVRGERAERLRREMETEFARNAAREEPRRRWRQPAGDDDTLPATVAFIVLGLDASTATWDEVVAAHRRLAKEHHPDGRPGADAATRAALERRMQEINSARDRLREHFGVRAAGDR